MDPELKVATFNTMPNQEYSLYGSILDNQLDAFLSRVKGICGMLPGNGEPVEDHTIIYSLKNVTPPISVRAVRSALFSSVPWRFQYYGAESPDVKNVTQRQIIDACSSFKLPRFLEELGFTMDGEFYFKGYAFAKNRVKITIGRIHKVHYLTNDRFERGEPLTSSCLVEISAVAFGGSAEPQPTHNDVIQVAEMLKPLVKMERLDARRLAEDAAKAQIK